MAALSQRSALSLARRAQRLALLREHALDFAFLIGVEVEQDREIVHVEPAAGRQPRGGLSDCRAGDQTENCDD